MNKVLSIKNGIELAKKLKKRQKTIVVAGGFFDILHLGHIKFLEKAKKYADYLFVLLEEDNKARQKGSGHPINNQSDRAMVLSAIESVDYIIMLKNMTNNESYDKLLIGMEPSVIATTLGDPSIEHKKRQAKIINCKLVYAIKRIGNFSTSEYLKLLNKK